MAKISYENARKVDAGLELAERIVEDYLMENQIDRSTEVDKEMLEKYGSIREIRGILHIVMDEEEEEVGHSAGLRNRLKDALLKLGIIWGTEGVKELIQRLMEFSAR